MNRSMTTTAIISWVLLALPLAAAAAGISVNLRIGTADDPSVDAGESATQLYSADGAVWNNVLLHGTSGSADTLIADTTGGSFISLRDDLGRTGAAQLTSTFAAGGGNSKFSGITATSALGAEGEAGLMASYLLMGGNFSSETLVVSGLDETFTANGYRVVLFFDIGTVLPTTSRILGYSVDDGSVANVCWAEDSGGDSSDVDDDGVMEWTRAVGSSQADATVGANYALFEGLSGASFTIAIAGASRGSLAGFQVVANDGPPPVVESFTASPTEAVAGETVTLSWSVSGADSVSISPDIGSVAAAGSTNITVEESTTFTLSAVNGSGTQVAEAAVAVDAGPVDVYLLGGQSNMQGKGEVSNIPAGQERVAGVLYYHSSTVKGATSPDTLYTSVTPTGAAVGWVGPEMGFAARIKELRPGRTMALIKYAVSGTNLAEDWYPGADAADSASWGVRFAGFVDTVNRGMAALRSAGYRPRIVGMLWQQGEADARSDGSPELYEANLVHFIARVREQFAADIAPEGMRFVQGTVLPYAPPGGTVERSFTGRDLVNRAKFNVDENSGAASAVPNVSTVACDDELTPSRAQILNDGDEVHLSAQAQLTLGRLMAEQMQAPDFSAWSAAHGLAAGPDGDEDGDGLSNGLEFFLGTDPRAPDSRSAAPASQPVALDAGDGLKDYFVVNFRQDMLRNAAGCSWRVDGATSLVDWAASAYEPVLVDRVNHSDGSATFRYRTLRPVDADRQSFLRLHLEFSSL